MIEIDKTDKLYSYLTKLGVEDVSRWYTVLAENGRYSPKDVQTYFYSMFQPSLTKEIENEDLEQLVDYYADLKKVKPIKETEFNNLLKRYKQKPTAKDKETIINAKLKELMYLAVNYKTAHPNVNVLDVVQLANVGLLNALDKYNPENKIAFKDYIIYWVMEEINKEIKNA